jgi:hypothetical protein|nr:MAG TPA: hypothetical protein [Caudoviricetes sp.]
MNKKYYVVCNSFFGVPKNKYTTYIITQNNCITFAVAMLNRSGIWYEKGTLKTTADDDWNYISLHKNKVEITKEQWLRIFK